MVLYNNWESFHFFSPRKDSNMMAAPVFGVFTIACQTKIVSKTKSKICVKINVDNFISACFHVCGLDLIYTNAGLNLHPETASNLCQLQTIMIKNLLIRLTVPYVVEIVLELSRGKFAVDLNAVLFPPYFP